MSSPLATAGRRRTRAPLIWSSLVFALVAIAPRASAAELPAPSDAQLADSLDRATVVRAAVARSPWVKAADQRARAVGVAADAEGRLPPPEAMVQVWQVPITRPYAVTDAQMIMLGVAQSFPSPGSRGARQAARTEGAHVEEAMARDRARMVARDAEHAFADYVEAVARHRVHLAHRDIGTRVFGLAQARYAAGGSLVEVTQAEAELARVIADVVTDAARIRTARARINALLARDPRAPLGDPTFGEPLMPSLSLEAALVRARAERPVLRAAEAFRGARGHELRAADREATWPSFSVAGLYFAPTSPMPQHGYGVNASMSLPWIWGAAGRRRDAQQLELEAAGTQIEAERIAVETEVVTADANSRSAALRLQVLRDRALPASRRAFDASWAGYESARTDLLNVQSARRALVDAEEGIVMARAALDHALAELDAAVGASVPRVSLGALPADALGGDHAL